MAVRVRELTADEAEAIAALARSRTAPARAVERAKIIRLVSEGQAVPAIAQGLGLGAATVRRWVKRFNERGLDGLADAPRSGCPPTYTAEEVSAVIAAALTNPRDLGLPFASWTLDRLEVYLNEDKGIGIKRSRIDQVLIAEGLRWRTQETWFGERAARERLPSPAESPPDGAAATAAEPAVPRANPVDPAFAQKRGVITRLYTEPPLGSVVVNLDEMGPVAAKSYPGQAVVRAQPATAGEPAERATQAIDYGRRGKGYIFGAFQPATGDALTRPYSGRTGANWADFLEQVDAWLPAEVEHVYAIEDNLSAHRATDVLLFSLAHPRWEFVFQPKAAAYLNLIEPWWKILRSLALKGRRFETWEEVCQAIAETTAYWNKHRHPFHWGRRRRHQPRRRSGVGLLPKVA